MFRQRNILRFISQSDNPYKILGVKPSANKAEIKKAYRALAAVHHPDAPGGNKDKFQRISSAYEQVKDGIYIPKSNGSGDGNNTGDRYANFRYTTAGSRGVRSYESFYKEMHMQGNFKQDFEDLDRRAKKNYVGDNPRVQAWFRLVLVWSSFFLVSRILLLILFPPGASTTTTIKGTGGDVKVVRKPPPPKPLPGMSPINPVF